MKSKSIKAEKYDAEGAVTVMEIAFYTHGNLNSLEEMRAGNAAVIRTGQYLIDHKRISRGLNVYVEAIQKAPSPIAIVTEAMAQYHANRAEEIFAAMEAERLANPQPEPVKKKRKKKKAAVEVDPNKPLTNAGVSFMKEALKLKQEKIEKKRKERVARIGKAGHHADSQAAKEIHGNDDYIIIDEAHIEVVGTSSFSNILKTVMPPAQVLQ
jgi:anti-sigma28 factor (negative regulator of flagellin synthesis)